jgi:hypothetical protein
MTRTKPGQYQDKTSTKSEQNQDKNRTKPRVDGSKIENLGMIFFIDVFCILPEYL